MTHQSNQTLCTLYCCYHLTLKKSRTDYDGLLMVERINQVGKELLAFNLLTIQPRSKRGRILDIYLVIGTHGRATAKRCRNVTGQVVHVFTGTGTAAVGNSILCAGDMVGTYKYVI